MSKLFRKIAERLLGRKSEKENNDTERIVKESIPLSEALKQWRKENGS
jgi:hypothetical protein